MSAPRRVEVEGREFGITFDRRIVRGQRDVIALARDAAGTPVAQQEMSTAAARGYLERDTQESPPTWEELEQIALDLLVLQLDEDGPEEGS